MSDPPHFDRHAYLYAMSNPSPVVLHEEGQPAAPGGPPVVVEMQSSAPQRYINEKPVHHQEADSAEEFADPSDAAAVVPEYLRGQLEEVPQEDKTKKRRSDGEPFCGPNGGWAKIVESVQECCSGACTQLAYCCAGFTVLLIFAYLFGICKR
jgi:hypothetical protein